MSIGISDLNIRQSGKFGLALVCCVSLSACVGGEGFSFAANGGSKSENSATSAAVAKTTQTTLARGAVKLKAPKGYCIDESSVSNGLLGSAAMLARCSSLDGKGAGAGTAVMSVQVSARRGTDAAAPTAQDLANAAAPNDVLKTMQKGDLALVKLASGGDSVFSPADPKHWRGATVLDTRLVLLGLFAPEGSDLTSDKGADLLASLARGLSATPARLLGLLNTPAQNDDVADEQNQPEAVQNASTTDTVDQEKKGGRGLIARLLNRS